MTEIKIETCEPPELIYKQAQKQFGVDFNKGVVFTVGDTIYSKFPISKDLFAHERTHVKQQAEIGHMKWWDRYFSDPQFRYDQELEAYQNQYRYLKNNTKNREQLNKALTFLARDLSGTMYGSISDHGTAYEAIKSCAK